MASSNLNFRIGEKISQTMNRYKWIWFPGLMVVVLFLITMSCTPIRKLKYLNDIDNFSEPFARNLQIASNLESITISPFNKLHIYVVSTDEKTSAILNNWGEATGEGNINGFVVDENGEINYPYVGKIKLSGLTLQEAGEAVSNALTSITTKPVVLVRFLENQITVLGEVALQGTFPISKEFITIYESLSLGGGFTAFADRENVILLRMENNKIYPHKLDLTNSKITSSQYFYVLPNDIIIVEPLKKKSWNNQSSMLTTVLQIFSSLMSIFYVITLTARF